MPATTALTPEPFEPSPLPLRPLRDDAGYQQARREVGRLWDAQPASPDGDRLQLLVLLIEAYEAEHVPIPPPDPAEAIRFRMEQSNLTVDDLASRLGISRRRVRGMLHGRPLTLALIRLLVERLGISADVLIRRPADAGETAIRSRAGRTPTAHLQ